MTHKYLRIRDQVIEHALQTPGNRVLSEHQICRLYGVSRTTAIKALNALEADKLVRREAGRGTFLMRSKANTSVRLMVNALDRPLAACLARLAEAFMAGNPDIDLRIEPVESASLVREIVTRPGIKVLCASHVGYLSEAGLLEPLHQLDGFAEVTRRMLDSFIGWRRDARQAPLCDSLPMMLTPEVLVVHRGQAGRLGLDPLHGPADWGELAAWLRQARRLVHHGQPVMGAALKRNYILPLSYLCALHGRRHVIRDEGAATTLAFERGEEWLAFFQELHRSGAMPYYAADLPDPVLFGNALTSPWASTWIVGQQAELAPAEDLGVMPIPPPRRGDPSCSIIGCCEVALVRQVGIAKRDREAGWRVVRFLVGDAAAQRLLASSFSCLSVLREVHAEQRMDPRMAPFLDALACGIMRNDHPLQHPLLRIVHSYFNQCVLEGMPPATARARIVEACALQLEMGRARIG